MRLLKLIALLAALLVMTPAANARSNYAPGSLDHYMALDWKVISASQGPVIEGFVYNKYAQAADRMRLSIEQLDGSGNVVGSSTTWVMGGVPPQGRGWFSTKVPAATAYRVEILSFDWVGRGN
jgi:hypothetical protein